MSGHGTVVERLVGEVHLRVEVEEVHGGRGGVVY